MWEFILFVSIVAAAVIFGMYLNTRIEEAVKKSNENNSGELVKCKICNKEYTGYYGPDIPYICVFCRDQVESNLSNIQKKARIKGTDIWP